MGAAGVPGARARLELRDRLGLDATSPRPTDRAQRRAPLLVNEPVRRRRRHDARAAASPRPPLRPRHRSLPWGGRCRDPRVRPPHGHATGRAGRRSSCPARRPGGPCACARARRPARETDRRAPRRPAPLRQATALRRHRADHGQPSGACLLGDRRPPHRARRRARRDPGGARADAHFTGDLAHHAGRRAARVAVGRAARPARGAGRRHRLPGLRPDPEVGAGGVPPGRRRPRADPVRSLRPARAVAGARLAAHRAPARAHSPPGAARRADRPAEPPALHRRRRRGCRGGGPGASQLRRAAPRHRPLQGGQRRARSRRW